MKMGFYNIKKMFCNSPMVEIVYAFNGKTRKCYAKCEWYSLTGSVKDRVAWQILKDAYKSGKLKTGDKIVEVSSGNMGISLCAVANLTGNPTTIIMPKNMSEERKQLLSLYGATLVEVNDFNEAFRVCEIYERDGYYCPRQFENESNLKVHSSVTAKEILRGVKCKNVSTFISGVGTSGTLAGVGEALKKQGFKIIALQPENAQILNGGKAGKHVIQGISDEIVPKLYDEKIVDDFVSVNDIDVFAMAQKLCKCLSLPVGLSSSANFLGCVLCGENAVTIFPDDNKKYLSCDIGKGKFESSLVDEIVLKSVKVV